MTGTPARELRIYCLIRELFHELIRGAVLFFWARMVAECTPPPCALIKNPATKDSKRCTASCFTSKKEVIALHSDAITP